MSRIPYLASPGLTVRKARPKSSPKHRGPLLLARSDEEDSTIHNATISASLPITSHRRGFSEFGRKMMETTLADGEEAPRCSTPFTSVCVTTGLPVPVAFSNDRSANVRRFYRKASGSTNEYDIQVARSMVGSRFSAGDSQVPEFAETDLANFTVPTCLNAIWPNRQKILQAL